MRYPHSTLISGTNLDDLSDHRPGLVAADQHQVFAPLAQYQVSKIEVRQIATAFGLSVDDLPAAPCLASRVAYGIPVTQERLAKIEAAEALVWDLGFSDVRIRLLPENTASIEVPLEEVHRFWHPAGAHASIADLSGQHQPQSLASTSFIFSQRQTQQFLSKIQELGFDRVAIDPKGLRSGSLNNLVSLGP